MQITSQKWRKEYLTLLPWSQYQKDIFNWCIEGEGNLAVEAVAGSGKTTSILGIVAALPSTAKIQIFAFNVNIQQKLKNDSRIPTSRVGVNTAHSYGKALIQGYFEGKEPVFKDSKFNSLIKQSINRVQYLYREYSAKSNALPGLDVSGGKLEVVPPSLQNDDDVTAFKMLLRKLIHFVRLSLTPWEIQDILNLIEYNGIGLESDTMNYWVSQATIWCLKEGVNLAALQHLIDFTNFNCLKLK